jgi:hypothetical protein
VADDGNWYLYGKTRKGSEFYGNLTALPVGDMQTADAVNDDIEITDALLG